MITPKRNLSILLLALFAIACLIALSIGVATLRTAAAQDGDPVGPTDPTVPTASSAEGSPTAPDQAGTSVDSAWSSSAEMSASGLPEQANIADTRSLDTPDAESALAALISWRASGSALKPRENDVSYSVGSSGACTYVTAGDASTVWNIPIHLPQGSTIDTLRMYYYDTSSSNTNAWFTAYDLYGSIVQEWSVSSSGNGGNSFNDSAAINHVIDYSVSSYMINWRPNATGSTLQLCGFRIFYEPPPFGLNFLPVVPK